MTRTADAPIRPDRNLALELVRVTEAAALAAARLVGNGREGGPPTRRRSTRCGSSSTVHMDGVVVIGEGEKDEAPMLYNGEQIGDGSPPHVDIAVDPLEGTRLTALGMPNACRGHRAQRARGRCSTRPVMYMEKLAGGDDVADLLDLDVPLGDTVRRVAERRASTSATSWSSR
jgi:fructose-1,6-bisphosphatase II